MLSHPKNDECDVLNLMEISAKSFSALIFVHLQSQDKLCPMKFAQYCSPGRALSVMMGIKQPGDLFAMEMTNDRRCAVSYF